MEITHLRIGESKKIYVTNLATQVTDEDLQVLCDRASHALSFGL